MPANLTPQYSEAEEKYKQAATTPEKLECLQEMLRLLPKHKGTEKIQADIKKRISECKKLLAKKDSKKSGPTYTVESHGHPQVVFIGPPNSGRSFVISRLTGVSLKVEEYPYTTRTPQPAIMEYENIKIQLVDTPAISATYMEPWLGNIIRAADAVVWLIDLCDEEILENIEALEEKLKKQKILLDSQGDLKSSEGMVKKTLVIGNRKGLLAEETNEEFLKELWQDREIFKFSSIEDAVNDIKRKIFEVLRIIRIYPKPPGKKVDKTSPIILKKDSTIWDLANSIHKDLAKNLKSARIWNSSQHSEGQNIPRDHVLQDENIIELTD